MLPSQYVTLFSATPKPIEIKKAFQLLQKQARKTFDETPTLKKITEEMDENINEELIADVLNELAPEAIKGTLKDLLIFIVENFPNIKAQLEPDLQHALTPAPASVLKAVPVTADVLAPTATSTKTPLEELPDDILYEMVLENLVETGDLRFALHLRASSKTLRDKLSFSALSENIAAALINLDKHYEKHSLVTSLKGTQQTPAELAKATAKIAKLLVEAVQKKQALEQQMRDKFLSDEKRQYAHAIIRQDIEVIRTSRAKLSLDDLVSLLSLSLEKGKTCLSQLQEDCATDPSLLECYSEAISEHLADTSQKPAVKSLLLSLLQKKSFSEWACSALTDKQTEKLIVLSDDPEQVYAYLNKYLSNWDSKGGTEQEYAKKQVKLAIEHIAECAHAVGAINILEDLIWKVVPQPPRPFGAQWELEKGIDTPFDVDLLADVFMQETGKLFDPIYLPLILNMAQLCFQHKDKSAAKSAIEALFKHFTLIDDPDFACELLAVLDKYLFTPKEGESEEEFIKRSLEASRAGWGKMNSLRAGNILTPGGVKTIHKLIERIGGSADQNPLLQAWVALLEKAETHGLLLMAHEVTGSFKSALIKQIVLASPPVRQRFFNSNPQLINYKNYLDVVAGSTQSLAGQGQSPGSSDILQPIPPSYIVEWFNLSFRFSVKNLVETWRQKSKALAAFITLPISDIFQTMQDELTRAKTDIAQADLETQIETIEELESCLEFLNQKAIEQELAPFSMTATEALGLPPKEALQKQLDLLTRVRSDVAQQAFGKPLEGLNLYQQEVLQLLPLGAPRAATSPTAIPPRAATPPVDVQQAAVSQPQPIAVNPPSQSPSPAEQDLTVLDPIPEEAQLQEEQQRALEETRLQEEQRAEASLAQRNKQHLENLLNTHINQKESVGSIVRTAFKRFFSWINFANVGPLANYKIENHTRRLEQANSMLLVVKSLDVSTAENQQKLAFAVQSMTNQYAGSYTPATGLFTNKALRKQWQSTNIEKKTAREALDRAAAVFTKTM